MWPTLAFGVLNFVIALIGKKALKLPGFDITPIAIIILARMGEGVLFPALILTLAFSVSSINRLKYLWLTVPGIILVGYLSAVIPNVYVLFVIYHVVCLIFASLLGFLGTRYFLFVMINVGLNIVVARLYLLTFTNL